MRPRVHIKIADNGWILEKCAREISSRCKGITYGLEDDPRAYIQYYMNYSARRQRVSPIELAFFTHSEREEAARQRYFDVASEVDHRVCMSRRYEHELVQAGFGDITTISPGVDLDHFVPKVRIGVVGRTYHTGRKGEALVAAVMDVPGIEWRFTGRGWPGPSVHVPDGDMANFYNDLDYVLVPALYEGGPMCVLEALACGIPVIASDVGWMEDFPHIKFDNGNAASLRLVLEDLVAQRRESRRFVEERNWQGWAASHDELFDRIWHGTRTSVAVTHATYRAAIVIHGSERSAKGGPTSRVANIVATAADMGEDIIQGFGIDSVCEPVSPDIAHIFNSWPLHSAIEQLIGAKRRGIRTVYSPIALNLSAMNFYQQALPQILHEAEHVADAKQGIAEIRALTPPFSADSAEPLIEGVPGHFDALRRGVALADHIICLSEYEKAFLEAVGCRPAALSIVRNGVDAQTMADGDASLFREKFGLDRFILSVGRIEPRKNQAILALALRDLKIPLVCIGHVGHPDYFNQVRKWAGSNFIHIDRIEDRQLLASAYKAAACFILNSWAEGAPLAALEAAAAGTPLILSNMASEREYFGSFADYVHPCDVSGLATLVKAKIDCPEPEAQRAERSAFAVARYDISRHTRDTLNLYARVLRDVDAKPLEMPAESSIVVDATHLAHQLANGQHLTGVTAVEYSVLKAVAETRPDTPVIVWNSVHRAYVPCLIQDVANGSIANVAKSDRLPDGCYSRAVQAQVAIVARPVKARIWRRLGRKLRHMAKNPRTLLPRGLRKRLGIGGAVAVPSPARKRFAVASSLTADSVRPWPELEPGTRLLLLGQPWISNARMLSDLSALVRANGLLLWAHVPDILYVTDRTSFDEATRGRFRENVTRLLGIADTVITISDQAARDIACFTALCGISVKTKRIRLGPNEELVEADPTPPAFAIPSRYILYVSSMNARKRHDFIREVWRDVRGDLAERGGYSDVGLIFVGTAQRGFERYGEDSFKNDLREEGISVLNDISSRELAYLYRNTMFTVYPPRAEGWGMPPVESLYFGKACIVSDIIPSAEEVNSKGLIRLPADDHIEWREAILKLIADESALTKICEEAKKFRSASWRDAVNILFVREG
ncbi:glycosyltransferase family 4 protein [Sphingomonas fennica]|nr:glycosyltransferase [Sphingomonas fennica]